MIDHLSVMVSDFAKSRAFYLHALAQTGHSKLVEVELPAAPGGHAQTAGFCHADGSDLWIRQGDANGPPIHLAFRVPRALRWMPSIRQPSQQAAGTTVRRA